MSGKAWLRAGAALLLAIGAGAAPAAADPPRTQLINAGCRHALLPAGRRISLTAVMRPVSGTAGMEMMFVLERARHAGARFAPVRGRGLGVWVRPDDPTLGQRPGDVWKFDQKVSNLSAPADYRFRVRFRWLGTNGHTLAHATELGTRCREPELRPDLLVRSLTVTPVTGAKGEDEYVARITNRGLTGAGPFELELVLPSLPTRATTVARVGPHATVTETFTAPACISGRPVSVVVDPRRAVPDYHRANNTLTENCP